MLEVKGFALLSSLVLKNVSAPCLNDSNTVWTDDEYVCGGYLPIEK